MIPTKDLIQRFSPSYESNVTAAGVYSALRTIDITINPFPVIINSFQASFFAYDNVTWQSIGGVLMLTTNIPRGNDPGLLSTDTGQLNMACQHGVLNRLDFYHEFAPSETFRVSCTMRVETVTANPIVMASYLLIGYLCPKDFLSQELFAANPE
jgi:hypothetical protein